MRLGLMMDGGGDGDGDGNGDGDGDGHGHGDTISAPIRIFAMAPRRIR